MAEYFQPNPALEQALEEKGKDELLEVVRSIPKMAEFSFVCQQEKKGLGHAIGTAKEAVGDEPFAVILPDDIIDSEVPALKQLLDTFARYKGSVVAAERVPRNEISAYGVVTPRAVSPSVSQVLDLVEKPEPEDALSELGIVGRYVLTPEIFAAIEATLPGSGGEIQITDGIKRLLKEQHVYALEFQGVRQDTGTPIGWLKAQLHFAFKDPEMRRELKNYISKMLPSD
jgi:UTP--glucose-1-phosphate uridylyltransferase